MASLCGDYLALVSEPALRAGLDGQRVLVTGATGFIGGHVTELPGEPGRPTKPGTTPGRRWLMLVASAAVVVGLGSAGCGQNTTELSDGASSADVAAGQTAYEQSCAACHGVEGQGTQQGPPFVDKVYEPSHHPDAAFVLAVKRGVRAHHWNFGDMPPQNGVSDQEIAQITAYVRGLQRQAGIE